MVTDELADWLTRHIHWFEPRVWERYLARRPFPESTLLELLILCRVLRRGRVRDHELLGMATELAAKTVRSAAFLTGISLSDHTFPYRSYLIALAEREGVDVGAARDRVRSALVTGAGGQTADWRPVLQRLELRYVLELGGFETGMAGQAQLVAESIAAGNPDPLFLKDDEVYALTHVVFYATDFAARPMPGDHLTPDLPRNLLSGYLARGDLDLSGELLLCLMALDAGPHRLDEYGWKRLIGDRLASGAVPGPLFDPARSRGLTGDKRDAYEFGTCHHTTMVAAMVAAERERRGHE